MGEVLARVLAFTEACMRRTRKSVGQIKYFHRNGSCRRLPDSAARSRIINGRNMMGRGPKVMLWACCAVAAMVLSGAGTAAATPISLAAQRTVGAEAVVTSQPDCNSSRLERWNLNGANNIDVAYDGLSFVYSVAFTQNGSCLTGTLDDPYFPTSGPISGTINGDSITFTFNYPSGSVQGSRTYTGAVSQSGAVSGTWTQTGDESPDNGTWTLARSAAAGISGEACVFNAPTGVAVVRGHKIFGHVGWGFKLASGYWEFGANEGHGSFDISNTWHATGTWQQMLNAFRQEGQHHSAGFYTQYKCATVSTTSADITDALATVSQEYLELYIPPGQDCESQVYNVLAAYGVKDLPSDMSPIYWPSPNNWFNHLSSAGFGGTTPL